MFKPKTYNELCMAMKTRATVDIDHHVGRINAIETVDGSGRNWNVTMYLTGEGLSLTEAGRTTVLYFREKE